jgi:signal transduction histidine kinase
MTDPRQARLINTAQPIRKQSPWGLWWLCIVTLSIYYCVWYHRINQELAAVLGEPVRPNGRWWNQLIPIWNLVGLGSTAVRLNGAHARLGSPTRVGVGVSWFWAPAWFASQTRYLQRRINVLHDVMASRASAAY